MFLAALSYKQRRIFLGLAKEILIIDDGVIDDSEEAYLRGLCSEMSLSYSDEKIINKGDILRYFNDSESKKILLLELIALGYSNGDYHSNQNKFSENIANLISISLEEFEEVAGLISNYFDVQSKFIEYIER